MKSVPQVVVTPKRIKAHNRRCLGRMILWGLAAASVFFLVFVFFWLMASVVTGVSSMNRTVGAVSTIFAVAFFVVGRRHLEKSGPQDWSRVARAPTGTPGMRIFGRKNFDYGQVGFGFATLFLAGPEWLGKMAEERKSMVPACPETAERLEDLRRHLAARDSWVPVDDFSSFRDDLYLLATLDVLAIRESAGQWFFHVTLEGSGRPVSVNEKGAGNDESGVEVEIGS